MKSERGKEIVEIKYYRRRYTNQAQRYGYLESGREVDIDDDGLWVAKSVRVEITKDQYEKLLAGEINMIEPYPQIEEHLYNGLTDTEGTPLKLGDWVMVHCDTLVFRSKVFVDHKYRLIPFDNYAWHKVVKLNEKPEMTPAWSHGDLIQGMKPDPRPNLENGLHEMLEKKKGYKQIQKAIFDYYGVQYNPVHYKS